MKLPASLLATLCAAGCASTYATAPQYQTVQVYELVDPRVETIEATQFSEMPGEERQFAQPPRDFAQPPDEIETTEGPDFGLAPAPQLAPTLPQVIDPDPCPACGMG